ncbi:uncharacterized protein LOC105663459 [Megachile rotundata]|uniref:uncharacterized protein LOC105663459 n=1 Tax=Megachile rotundata TaxID=143995 RepID=UPI000614A114|nr:PREDICTED: uncharacterized protein LOC105663459 [Megachile rotundata]
MEEGRAKRGGEGRIKRSEYAENMANEAERRSREASLVPRVARGCQPQDNNFIIGGITLARRGTVPVRGVGGSTDIVSIRTDGTGISSPAVSSLGRSRGFSPPHSTKMECSNYHDAEKR